MTDLASLGIRVESQDVAQADARLDKLAATAGRTERATDGLNTSFKRDRDVFTGVADDAARLSQAHDDLTGSNARLTTAQRVASNAMQGQHVAVTALRPAVVGLVGALGTLILPLTIVGGLVAAAGYLWMDGEKSALGYDRAVTGVGRTAGLTATELRDLTVAGAEQADMSIRGSQEMAAAYLRTARVGRESLGQLLAVTKDFASFTGQDLPAAQRQLATAMDDPAKAAVTMTREFGLLTQAQIKQVEAAVKAGDAAKAQKILLDAVANAANGHADKIGVITSAWDAVGRSISNAITKFGEWMYITESEKLADMDKRLQPGFRGVDGEISLGSAADRRARLQAERDELARTIGLRRGDEAVRARNAAANQAAQLAADQRERPGRTSRASSGPTDAERAYGRLISESLAMVEAMQRERREMGLTEAQLIRLNAVRQAREVSSAGTQEGVALAGQILDEAQALISAMADFNLEPFEATAIKPLDLRVPDMITNIQLLAEEMRTVDGLARDMADGLASAFGDAGGAAGDLLTTMTEYRSYMADLAAMEEGGMDVTRQRGAAQQQVYGDMAAAARGFFKEGSDGYKVMLAIEQAYRLQQMMGMMQSMIFGKQEAASSIAGSMAKGAASMAAGAAKMFESLGPWAFPVVAAMIGVLAGLGLRGGGGGGKGSSAPAANDNAPDATTAAVRGQTERQSAAQAGTLSSMAQQVKVAVEFDDPMFRARVQKETAPMVVQGGQVAARVGQNRTEAALARRQAYTVRG